MFEKTKSELVPCDRALAVEFSQMPALPGERPLKPARLACWRNHLKAGTFKSPTWAVAIDKKTGERFRANGQHTSTVLAELSEAEFPKDFKVTIDEYTSDDLAKDSFLIFDLFDNPVASRTNVDVINQYIPYYEDLKVSEDLTPQLLSSLLTGIGMYEKSLGEKGSILLPRQRGAYLEKPEYRSFVLWSSPFDKTLHSWMLKKPGIVAEMISDRRVDQEIAEKFWQLVFTESHPDQDHETRELSRTLKDWASKKEPKVPQERFRREAAKRWRQFRRIQTAPKMNYDTPSPEVIGSQPEATL